MFFILRLKEANGPDALSKVHFEQVLATMIPPSRAAQLSTNQRNGTNSNATRELINSLEPLVEALRGSI